MKKIESYSLDKETVSKIIDPIFQSNHVNSSVINDIILRSLNSNSLELIMTLMHTSKEYKPFKIGDMFRTPLNTYTEICESTDELEDLSLLKVFDNEPFIYGKILGDDSYNSDIELFDPYYWKMKVELYGVQMKKFHVYETTVYTKNLIKTHKVPFKLLINEEES